MVPRSPDPIWCSWFAGLVDGEGHFAIHRNRGEWANAELRVNMRADDRPMLQEICRELGFGKVYGKPGIRGNPMAEYRVSHRRHCLALVRIFDQYLLRSRKRKDYEVWRTFVLLHQQRQAAGDPRIEQLFQDIRDVRKFQESPDAQS